MIKTSLPYAFGMSLGSALIILLAYLLGYHNDLARFQSGQYISMVAGLLVMVVALVLGMRAVRTESPNQSLSYGRAIGTGTLITTLSGVMSAVFSYVYGKVINPEFHQMMYEFQITQVAERMTSAQIEQAAPMMRFFTSAGWIASTQLLVSPIFGVIASAIIGPFVKRTPKAGSTEIPAA